MIDRKKLGFALSAKFNQFAKLENAEVRGRGEYDRHIFIDNGANILGVAHLDSVNPFRYYKITDNLIKCATVDDRIGVYMMLYGLPMLGIKCDVLLTDHEEVGYSTAQFFRSDKDYNWMFQFDRGYDDVVLYQYENPLLEDELEAAGFNIGIGSFSDISYMDNLGCRGFNIGCGMRNYHSKNAYVHINTLLAMATCFRYFWSANKDRVFDYHVPKYIPTVKQHGKYKVSTYDYDLYENGKWEDDMYVWPGGWQSNKGPDRDNDYIACDYCGNYQSVESMKHIFGDEAIVCQACFNHIETTWFDDEVEEDEEPIKAEDGTNNGKHV